MIVRAKRLVFENREKFVFAAQCGYGEYRVWALESRNGGGWGWSFTRHGNREPEETQSMRSREECEVECQLSADAKWLADTEVVPLEWIYNRTFKEIYADTPFGRYHNHGGSWTFSGDEIIRPAASDEEITLAANQHNRDLVLGKAG